MYCRNTFECYKRDDIPVPIFGMICVEIETLKAKPYHALSRYRPSDTKETILLEDTNCNFHIKNDESSSKNLPNNIKRLADIYNSFGLTQLLREPTRETIDTSTTIDHRAVNTECYIIESGVLKLAISDHYHEKLFLKDLAKVDWQRFLLAAKASMKWYRIVPTCSF